MKIGEKATVRLADKATGEIKYTFQFESCESGAFEYGNKTCVYVSGGVMEECFDTRYYRGGMNEFVKDWFEENVDKNRFALA